MKEQLLFVEGHYYSLKDILVTEKRHLIYIDSETEVTLTLIEGSRLKDGWRCNWLSVSILIKFDRAVMIYKIINGLCPDNLKGRLATRSQISNYSTRNYLNLDILRQNLEFFKKSFFYCGAQTWNEIPVQIKTSSTITTFKKKLKECLQN